MKTYYPHIFLFLLIVVGSLSCSKENDIIKEITTYHFSSLQWKLNEGDGQEIVTVQVPEKIYVNKRDTPLNVEFDVLDDIKFSSFFKADNMEMLNKWGGTDLEVFIPSKFSLLSLHYKYFTCGITAPLIAGQEIPIQPGVMITSKTDLPPKTKMVYKATVYLEKISASYRATFIAEGENGDYIDVEGKWTGTFFHKIEEETVFDDIK